MFELINHLCDRFWLLLVILMPVATVNLILFQALARTRLHPVFLKKLWRCQLGVLLAFIAACLVLSPAATLAECLGSSKAEGATLLLTRLFGGAWALLTTGLMAKDLWGVRRTTRMISEWRPLRDPAIIQLLRELRGTMGLRRRVRAFVTKQAGSPFIFGALTQKLVLPERLLSDLDRESLRCVLAHELVHFRDKDGFWGVLNLILGRFLAVNPLLPWHDRAYGSVVEKAADAEAIALACLRPAHFARGLLQVLERQRQAPVTAMNFSPSYVELRNRLQALERPAVRMDQMRSSAFLFIATSAICAWSVSQAQNKMGFSEVTQTKLCAQIHHEEVLEKLLHLEIEEKQCAPLKP